MDPTTAVILLDVVLGYGANADPAGALASAIEGARSADRVAGPRAAIVASVCGTEDDPQGLSAQEATLAGAGVVLADEQRRRGSHRRGHRRPRGRHGRGRERETTAARSTFFADGIHAVNIGLDMFAAPLPAHGASVDGPRLAATRRGRSRPRAAGWRDSRMIRRIRSAGRSPLANAQAVERLLAAQPMLIDVRACGDGARARVSPVAPRRSADRVGADVRVRSRVRSSEPSCSRAGRRTPDEASKLARLRQDRALAVPSPRRGRAPWPASSVPSMPVVVVENVAAGTRGHATLNEGLGKVLRFGAYDEGVLKRLRWMADVLGPALSRAVHGGGPLDLRSLTGQALQMGDEGHNRNIAATSLFTRAMAPALVRIEPMKRRLSACWTSSARTITSSSTSRWRPASRPSMPRSGIDGSTVVTAMSAQRRRLRGPALRDRRHAGSRRRWASRTGCTSRVTAPTTRTPTSAIARSPRPLASAGSRWPPRRRSSGSSVAAPADALEFTRLMGRITLARNPSYAVAPARVRWNAHRDRCPARRRFGDRTRSSTPASPIARQASARSARGSRGRRSRASPPALRSSVDGSACRSERRREAWTVRWLRSAETRSSSKASRGTIAEQYENARETAQHIAALVAAGWGVVVTHGNGPQVGFILLRSELVPKDAPIPQTGPGDVGRRLAGRDRAHPQPGPAQRTRRAWPAGPRRLRPDPCGRGSPTTRRSRRPPSRSDPSTRRRRRTSGRRATAGR